ncbi:MAG: hypothetical protein LBI03_04840, partial [Clostridiales bacterium]|nr:hypothetical protein [Clostridiales bacterium]
MEYAKNSKDELFDIFSTGINGYSEEKAEEIREESGENIIVYTRARPWFVKLILSFMNPFSLVLFLVAAVSFVAALFTKQNDWPTIIIILSLITISSLLQFFQESKSDKAVQKLKAMVSSKATVKRSGKPEEIAMKE